MASSSSITTTTPPHPTSSTSHKHTTPTKKPLKSKWETPTQEKIYSRRLVSALRSAATATPTAVKSAADSALAATANGQSKWSRAILSKRWKARRRRKRKVAVRKGRGKAEQSPRMAGGERGKVKERLGVLGRIVPGCRKASAGCLLSEAADYVAALQMQVKAMRALADAFSGASIASNNNNHDDDDDDVTTQN